MKCPAILLGLLVLAACAGRTAQPVATMNTYDNDLSCEQIQAEIQSNEAKASQLVDEENSDRNSNIAIGAVGFLLLWPALFALDLSDAERIEIQALHERNTHLSSLYRDCASVASVAGSSRATARAIRHGAYDGKWIAEGPDDGCGLPWAIQMDIRNDKAEGMLWRGKLAYNFAGVINQDGRLEKALAGKTAASNGIVGPRFITVNMAFKEDRANGDYSMAALGGECTVPVVLARHQA